MDGVNKMGLFTEDLEKTDSNVKVQATIVEGPVSPQTPTSPLPATEQSAPAAKAAAEAPSTERNSNIPSAAAVTAEEDDDDDLFKEN